MLNFRTSAALLLLIGAQAAAAQPSYPETRRMDVVDDYFGQKVADPYRWLEHDAREDKEVAAWVTAQNKATNAYLDTLPGRDIFRDRLTALFDHERFGVPVHKGGRYFYTHNSGLQNQSLLYVRDRLDGPGRVLLDPNGWSKDGATALAEWSPSRDGRKLGYSIQEGGTDWRTIRVIDVDTGTLHPDEIKWAQWTTIEWDRDGTGFFYERFPETKSFQSTVGGHSIYYHRLGTPQAQDRLVHATPDLPTWSYFPKMTGDGRYLTISIDNGSQQPRLAVIDLESRDWKVRPLGGDFTSHWIYAGNAGSTFYILTSKDAGRFKLVSMDLADADAVAKDVVSEQDAVLKAGALVGDRLLLTYWADVKSELRRYTLDGKPDGVVPLPGIGTVSAVEGGAGGREGFFEFTSFNAPGTIYRYDVATNRAQAWAQPRVKADLANIVVEQRFYTSKDGTRVPMFVVRRRDVTGPAPTILYGYGGFFLSYPPGYTPQRLAWVEQGGVYAIAHIRGGNEYGAPWHLAGRMFNKQNVFDDFIAAAEYLKAAKITPADGLAIQGGSNGGLLVSTVTNQRPELFQAALPMVPVTEMVRFPKFTSAAFWMAEYGSPDVEAEFRNMYRYSPYHNIRSGVTYPAILATTADTDDRVVPWHSFKYVAALQAAEIGPRPHLVRIETRAGHGSGKPVDKQVAETADLWAFAAKWTGLQVRPVGPAGARQAPLPAPKQ